jgi:heat-inducible transcriptional repressor
MSEKVLTDREACVLSTIVQDYVLQAEPAGSRAISKKSGLALSPATIRNIVSDLEERGYVDQPHTSAGRMPTDKGYRYYVDHLIGMAGLSSLEKEAIERQYEQVSGGFEEIARATCRMLASLSSELGVVLSPRFYSGTFRRLNIVEIAEKRVMLVLSIETGLINTLMVEAETAFPARELEAAAGFLNERLSGKKLSDIEKNLNEMVRTDDEKKTGIIRLFVEHSDQLFKFPEDKILVTNGTTNMLGQPEFLDKARLETIIELIEDKKVLVHLFDGRKLREGVFVTIGGENEEGRFKSLSIVTSSYSLQNISGTLGVLGPTRMPYPKLISLVDYVAKVISQKFQP